MPKVNTPAYISALLQPVPGRGTDRKVWSIPLQEVWIPFFTATNTAGETLVSHEALGAPLRLIREKDGTPKFSENGRPVIRVVKELADQVRIVRENFMAGLANYADSIRKGMANEYKAQVEAARKVGEAIANKDMADIHDYILKAQAEAEVTAPEPEKELVPA